jgi:protein-disulfide isomerase
MLDELYVGRGQLMIAFRHLPLEAIHPMAFQAAQAAECANQQGKFWTIHNSLFRQGRNLSTERIGELARSAGLAKDVMDQCLPAARIRVQQDIHSAQALGLRATPAFLIGEVHGRHVKVDQVLVGNVQIGEFTVTIDRLLHQASAAHVGARP